MKYCTNDRSRIWDLAAFTLLFLVQREDDGDWAVLGYLSDHLLADLPPLLIETFDNEANGRLWMDLHA